MSGGETIGECQPKLVKKRLCDAVLMVLFSLFSFHESAGLTSVAVPKRFGVVQNGRSPSSPEGTYPVDMFGWATVKIRVV